MGLSQKLRGVRMVQDTVTGLDDSDRIMASAVAERYACRKGGARKAAVALHASHPPMAASGTANEAEP